MGIAHLVISGDVRSAKLVRYTDECSEVGFSRARSCSATAHALRPFWHFPRSLASGSTPRQPCTMQRSRRQASVDSSISNTSPHRTPKRDFTPHAAKSLPSCLDQCEPTFLHQPQLQHACTSSSMTTGRREGHNRAIRSCHQRQSNERDSRDVAQPGTELARSGRLALDRQA